MDGVTRIAYNTSAFPIDYAFVGSAYINGDYREGPALGPSDSGQLMVSLSTGMHFATTVLASKIPSGYDVAGLQDVNGNGRADILFTSDSGSRLLVWYMDGATRSAYNSHAIDSNYRLVGKGDMNGDHRGDLVMSNPEHAADQVAVEQRHVVHDDAAALRPDVRVPVDGRASKRVAGPASRRPTVHASFCRLRGQRDDSERFPRQFADRVVAKARTVRPSTAQRPVLRCPAAGPRPAALSATGSRQRDHARSWRRCRGHPIAP